ncbi:TPA: (2Fe-2S) ferredoxin domain-containing protein [Candidatus Bipolaricaulota bacterium]|nr:(2Fe-2S) ferredoxin domain-containing protein [Candidatus Bipolaricaulota bacterium]
MKPEDLRRIREQAREKLRLRAGKARVKVVVGMGTSGLAAGARQVLKAVMDELARRGIDDVIVTQTGERGLAAKEPVVEVHEGGRITVYGEVDEALARRIVAEHVVNGRAISDRVLEVREVEA